MIDQALKSDAPTQRYELRQTEILAVTLSDEMIRLKLWIVKAEAEKRCLNEMVGKTQIDVATRLTQLCELLKQATKIYADLVAATELRHLKISQPHVSSHPAWPVELNNQK